MAVNAAARPLRIYTPQTHPAQWTSTQTNLANALQYLPSVHQQENLDGRCSCTRRSCSTATRRWTRWVCPILSNQGNALGHLGVFTDAKERLERARDMFATAGDMDAATTVSGILAGLEEAAGVEPDGDVRARTFRRSAARGGGQFR